MDLDHIAVHLGTDPLTRGKKVLYDHCFPQHILIADLLAILPGETERHYRIQYGQLGFCYIRDLGHNHIESHDQEGEKSDVEYGFLTHAVPKLRSNQDRIGHKLQLCCIYFVYLLFNRENDQDKL
jgi:hypothetical protein